MRKTAYRRYSNTIGSKIKTNHFSGLNETRKTEEYPRPVYILHRLIYGSEDRLDSLPLYLPEELPDLTCFIRHPALCFGHHGFVLFALSFVCPSDFFATGKSVICYIAVFGYYYFLGAFGVTAPLFNTLLHTKQVLYSSLTLNPHFGHITSPIFVPHLPLFSKINTPNTFHKIKSTH